METRLLEINLISAQGLKPSSTNRRPIHSYAIAWIDSSFKLCTRIDRIGGENPTWNDKFIFRVSPEFLSNDTSAVSIEIYAVGYLRDLCIGTVRFLVGNCLSGVYSSPAGVGIPSCTALQIRRPSGRFHGVLNIGAMVIKDSEFTALNGISAIGYRDLMGENLCRRERREKPVKIVDHPDGEKASCEDSCGEFSGGNSDDGDSSTSSSSTPKMPSSSTLLKVWNGRRQMMAGKKEVRILCGLGFHRKIHLSPSDQNLQA